MGPFHDVATTPAGHFTLLLHTAVLHLVRFIQERDPSSAVDGLLNRYPFLAEFLVEVVDRTPPNLAWSETADQWTEALMQWESELHPTLPMRRLETRYDMTIADRIAVMLTGLVEEDGRFGTLFAELQAPVLHRRPTPHLVGGIVTSSHLTGDGPTVCLGLVERGILEMLDETAPTADRAMRVPGPIWAALRGNVRPQSETLDIDDLVLSKEVRTRMRRAGELLSTGAVHRVLIRGAEGSDRRLAAHAVAAAAGLDTMRLDHRAESAVARSAAVAAVASGAAIVCEQDLDPGQSGSLPDVGSVPMVVISGRSGGFPTDEAHPTISVEIPPLDERLRRKRWARALAEAPLAEPEAVARDLLLPGAIIARVAGAATVEALLRSEPTIGRELIRAELRRETDRRLETLAKRISDATRVEELIVGDHTRSQLDDLVQRCRFREQLADRLAASSARSGLGVRALFTGASGTGKTLAARVMARKLGLDIYRVDLAAVFDKYVGETEKNLHRVLAEAEQLNVVLLLDEGDSLLGARTEVRSANDRYANLETNFLLQRLEDYDGIAFVTTNEVEHIDHAFARRMDATVAFPRPGPSERLAIWRLHLPAGHAISDEDVIRLAGTHALTGGQIRNAAQHATLIALADGAQLPLVDHLELAISNEYHKAGAMHPRAPSQGAAVSRRLVRLMDANQ